MTRVDLKKYIRDIPDFPRPGIIFKDISPLLQSPRAYKLAIQWLAEELAPTDVIVSPDARGFLFGPPVGVITNTPFVMIRKPDKLPGRTMKVNYQLEYATSTLEIIDGLIKPGSRVTIIDDVLATGGTTNAIIKLIKQQGGIVTSAIFLVELAFLHGVDQIHLPNAQVKSLISF